MAELFRCIVCGVGVRHPLKITEKRALCSWECGEIIASFTDIHLGAIREARSLDVFKFKQGPHPSAGSYSGESTPYHDLLGHVMRDLGSENLDERLKRVGLGNSIYQNNRVWDGLTRSPLQFPVEASPFLLQCDLDSNQALNRFILEVAALQKGSSTERVIRAKRTFKSASEHHHHGYAILQRPLPTLARIALQRKLGSDNVREDLALQRITRGVRAPLVLYENLDTWYSVQTWREDEGEPALDMWYEWLITKGML